MKSDARTLDDVEVAAARITERGATRADDRFTEAAMEAPSVRDTSDDRIGPGHELLGSTAGSVDDGKSTLIGRLLYDTKTAFVDQLEAVEDVSRRRGDERVNLALLTDGLRAER